MQGLQEARWRKRGRPRDDADGVTVSKERSGAPVSKSQGGPSGLPLLASGFPVVLESAPHPRRSSKDAATRLLGGSFGCLLSGPTRPRVTCGTPVAIRVPVLPGRDSGGGGTKFTWRVPSRAEI